MNHKSAARKLLQVVFNKAGQWTLEVQVPLADVPVGGGQQALPYEMILHT